MLPWSAKLFPSSLICDGDPGRGPECIFAEIPINISPRNLAEGLDEYICCYLMGGLRKPVATAQEAQKGIILILSGGRRFDQALCLGHLLALAIIADFFREI